MIFEMQIQMKHKTQMLSGIAHFDGLSKRTRISGQDSAGQDSSPRLAGPTNHIGPTNHLYFEYWKYDSHGLPSKGVRTGWLVWLIWYFAELWNCESLSRKPNCQFPRLANLSRTGKSAGVGSSSRTIHSPTPQSDTCGRLHTSGPPLNACAKPSQAEI